MCINTIKITFEIPVTWLRPKRNWGTLSKTGYDSVNLTTAQVLNWEDMSLRF